MGRSLMDVARSIVESNDSAPDRDAKKKTANSSTLRPGSKFKEADPKKNSAKLVATAPVTVDDKSEFGWTNGVGKDTSASSRSPNAPEPMHKLSEDVEELIIAMMEEGMSDEEIEAALEEAMSESPEETVDESRLDEIFDKTRRGRGKLERYFYRNSEKQIDNMFRDKNNPSVANDQKNREDGVKRAVRIAKSKFPTMGKGKVRHWPADLDESADEDFIESVFAEGLEEGYSEDEIAEALAEYFEGQEEVDEGVGKEYADAAKSVTERILADDELTVSEDVDALLEGEDLSEEFKSKAETIFQAAVATRLQEGVEILESKYAAALEEHVEQIYAQLHEEINEVLNYVVEQWMQDNEVAIESGLRTELSEDFISGLRQLFMEHYVDIPENEASLIDAMGSQIEELEDAINEEIAKNASLSTKLNEMAKHEITSAITEGLTTTQAEKLHTLAEGVEFDDPETYAEKVLTLRESYFPQSGRDSSAGLDNNSDDFAPGSGLLNEDNSRISKYAKALAKR